VAERAGAVVSEVQREPADGAAGAARDRRPLRVAAIGVSTNSMCGVRDHAKLLADGLVAENVSCSMHWLSRTAPTFAGAWSELRDWTGALASELEREQPDAVLLHYSVFTLSYKGVPVFVPGLLAASRRARAPLVTVLHEYAYPWRTEGLRGTAWALTQRAVLIAVVRASAALVVTIADRAREFARAPWLLRGEVAVVPVFSNLPPASTQATAPIAAEGVIGMFGYAYEKAPSSLVMAALRALRDRGREARLELLGAPGSDSAAGREWLAAAREHGVERALSFSGPLSPQQLSDALAACEVLLFTDPVGPTSRKTTLAASLASGRPLVAIDGPRSWPELLDADAALIAQPNERALSDALARLLADGQLRDAIAGRGRAFAERAMSVRHSAEALALVLDGVIPRGAS
jgi:glycosyltransferase involved in cell wall biosynthesis